MHFIPELSVLIPFVIATIIIDITPGPDMALFTGRALTQGRAAGIACALGASASCVIHTAFVALGLSALIVASQPAFLALKIIGAGYLAWIAVQTIRHRSHLRPDTSGGAATVSFLRNWLTGVTVNLTNPKVILFFMTFLPQFVSASDPHAAGKLFFLGLLYVVISMPFNFGFVLAADHLAGFLKRNPRVTRAIDVLFASIFAGFALRILAVRNG